MLTAAPHCGHDATDNRGTAFSVWSAEVIILLIYRPSCHYLDTRGTPDC